jgi:hypothetical protein
VVGLRENCCKDTAHILITIKKLAKLKFHLTFWSQNQLT